MFSHFELKVVFQSIGEKSIVNAKFTLFRQVAVNASVLWPHKLLSCFRESAEQSPCGQVAHSASFFCLLSTEKTIPESFLCHLFICLFQHSMNLLIRLCTFSMNFFTLDDDTLQNHRCENLKSYIF
jgi:hypothetical protein